VSTLFPSFVQFSREFKYPNSIIIQISAETTTALLLLFLAHNQSLHAMMLPDSRTPDSILSALIDVHLCIVGGG
jgi:hypothetical protein